MRAPLIAARAALVLLFPLSLVAAEFKLPEADATPAELVNAALRSEIDGPSDARKDLLDQALKLDPNYAPARWHSGYVRYDDEWLTLDEVAKRASDDKQLAEYRKRRDALIDRAEDHRELARWCKKNQLTDEARVHWAKVLEFDPADGEALAALGLQLYEGQLLTKQQIAESKKQAGERMQALKRWQPQMVKWRKAIETLKGHDYDFALHELRKLNDVEALPALEGTFAENVSGPKADALNLALIETAGRIQSPEATQVLLRRAIQPESEAVRDVACDQLKKRPMYAYVPQLIAAMPAPSSWKIHYRVFLLPSGIVNINSEFEQDNGRVAESISYSAMINIYRTEFHGVMTWLDGTYFDPQRATAVTQTLETIRQEALALKSHDERQNALRDRVCHVLKRTTEMEAPGDRAEWVAWWNDHAETYTPTYAPHGRSKHVANYQDLRYAMNVTYDPMSCFPSGTPVLTIDGRRPIESLQGGDRVICENPTTGELVAKPVQGTTLRPAAPLVKLTLGSRTLSATRGHPFWVNGQGWTMAKHLKVGQILHGIDGAVRIDAIEEAPAREAYNLVVGDYGTYFVGETPVLVHDNTPITETNAVVPGLELAATP